MLDIRNGLYNMSASTTTVQVLSLRSFTKKTDKEAGEEAVGPLQTRVANSHDGTSEQTKKQSICCKLALQ